MSAAFTQGPWYALRYGPEVGADPFEWTVSCSIPDPIDVATIRRGLTSTEAEAAANAHLIAAAPELYEALEYVRESLGDPVPVGRRHVARKVDAALAKARGAA